MKKIVFIIFVVTFAFGEMKPFDYDPFVEYLPKKTYVDSNESNKTKPKPLFANSVFMNKVFINGSWYKKGDTIRGYKIISINANRIKLKYKSKIKTLPIGGKNFNILKIKDKK